MWQHDVVFCVLHIALQGLWLHVPLLSTATWSLRLLSLTGHGVCHRGSPGNLSIVFFTGFFVDTPGVTSDWIGHFQMIENPVTNELTLWVQSYAFVTWQCRRMHYVFTLFVCVVYLSWQILLSQCLVNETYQEYLVTSTDNLVRFWRSKVKFTPG